MPYTSYVYYLDLGLPSSITDAKGNNSSYTYDISGRLKTETLNVNDLKVDYTKTIEYYDSENRIYQKFGNTNGYQEGQVYYDELTGKPRLVQRKLNGVWVTQSEMDYDSNGRKLWEQGDLKNPINYLYDELDRVSQIQKPDRSITKFEWDDHKLTITDAKLNKQEKFYDMLDRLIKVWDHPDSNTTYETLYEYDTNPKPHIVQVTNPRGVNSRIKYTYDNLGNLIQIDYPQDGIVPMATEMYRYDAVGNLKSKQQDNILKTYNYEFFNGYRIKTVTTQPDCQIVDYTYDAKLCYGSWAKQ
jgi:YD repeat-containing protein